MNVLNRNPAPSSPAKKFGKLHTSASHETSAAATGARYRLRREYVSNWASEAPANSTQRTASTSMLPNLNTAAYSHVSPPV